MKLYRGERTFDGINVTAGDQTLSPRHELKTFTRNHFEWGYEGPESRQLALAIIADAVDDQTALRYAEGFMQAIVANFSNEWEISQDQVCAALKDLETLS